MNATMVRTAKWLIGIQSLVALFVAMTSVRASESGSDLSVALCAVLLTIASLALAYRPAHVPSSAARFGGLVILGVFAVFFVRTWAPAMAAARPLAVAHTRSYCGNPLLGLPFVPFIVAKLWSTLSTRVASLRATRVVRALAVTSVAVFAVGSIAVVQHSPRWRADVSDWIEAQPSVATIPASRAGALEPADRFQIARGLWLNRFCSANFSSVGG